MIERDDIARAARNNDALAEEIGFEAFLAHHQIEVSGLVYVSQQRALRVGLITEGRNPNPSPSRPVTLKLSEPVRALLPVFGSAWMDGFATGLVARHDSSHDIPGIDTSGEAELRAEVKAALEGDSNDAEHDALVSVAEYLHIDYEPSED